MTEMSWSASRESGNWDLSGLSTFIFCSSESGDFLTGLRKELCVFTGVSTSSGLGKSWQNTPMTDKVQVFPVTVKSGSVHPTASSFNLGLAKETQVILELGLEVADASSLGER